VKPISEIAADFNAIAEALGSRPPVRRPSSAERSVLAAIPDTARRGLDCGCGDGWLARWAAARGLEMTAIDVSPLMIALARSWTEPPLRIDYRVADVMDVALPPASFDVVIAVNVVHHLPPGVILPRLASLVAPGGRLIIQDVVTRDGLRYLPVNLVAALRSRLRRARGASPHGGAVARLYDRHGLGETYLRPNLVRPALTPFLPSVVVTHHVDWRYTAIWHRPPAT
jgi:SAM-dependent methyltransferase